jgi:hypothetical protein
MQPPSTQILSGASFPQMEITPSNLSQTSGARGTQVAIVQNFLSYTPPSHTTSTKTTIGPTYQVYHPGGTRMPDAPSYSQ